MRKKVFIIIILILVVSVGVWKIIDNRGEDISKSNINTEQELSNQNKSSNNTTDTDKSNMSKSNDKNQLNEENSESNEDAKINVNDISGFTSKKSDSGVSNRNNNYNSNDISLPYTIMSTGMEIKSIGKYSGEFVEDGTDKKVSNILSIVVTNTSEQDLQYGEIKLKVNGKTAIFKLTNIPSGKSVLAIESTGSMKYSSSDNYKYEDSTYGLTNMSMNNNKIKISTKDSKVAIENISGKDLGTVYVYYKNLDKSGVYLGGITYRVKFENVKKGDILVENTKHFSEKNSKVVMVETEK